VFCRSREYKEIEGGKRASLKRGEGLYKKKKRIALEERRGMKKRGKAVGVKTPKNCVGREPCLVDK